LERNLGFESLREHASTIPRPALIPPSGYLHRGDDRAISPRIGTKPFESRGRSWLRLRRNHRQAAPQSVPWGPPKFRGYEQLDLQLRGSGDRNWPQSSPTSARWSQL